jgi:hypothetical protein
VVAVFNVVVSWLNISGVWWCFEFGRSEGGFRKSSKSHITNFQGRSKRDNCRGELAGKEK